MSMSINQNLGLLGFKQNYQANNISAKPITFRETMSFRANRNNSGGLKLLRGTVIGGGTFAALMLIHKKASKKLKCTFAAIGAALGIIHAVKH